VTLHLYDSATRALRELVPLRAGHVGIYVCGATVQGPPHIGHLKTDVAFDVLVRWLRRSGLDVTVVRNVTDIDDKILAKSAEAGLPWWAWAQRYEREFTAADDALGVLPPTYEPRATGHVPEMVELIDRLVDRGYAYVTGGGDVWFDVRAWPEYGALTNQRPEDLPPAEDALDGAYGDADTDADATGKRDPRDFALWKAPKADEPESASWPTPYGRGRPGWHLECSAMARRYLGPSFDIHGGGRDLRFPHHENELAQSRAAGDGFAGLWMHTGLLNVNGAKMSKSLGNYLLVADVLAQARPVVVRYALTAGHYRSTLEYGPDTLVDAQAAWERIGGFVDRATERAGAVALDEVRSTPLPAAFAAAMDDDLNVPAALAVVHEHVTAGNTAYADGGPDDVRASLVAVRGMLDVLGLDPAQWESAEDGPRALRAHRALGALVTAELAVRQEARATKDWAAADAVRDRLAAAGIAVEDSPTGPRWSLAEEG
jgi:cysteinyl-tRNA synthetase